MKPGKMPLGPTPDTSTSVTWTRAKVPAQGAEYTLILHNAFHDDGDHMGDLLIHHLSIVVEVIPSA